MGRDRNYDDGQRDGYGNTYNPPVPISPLDEMLVPDDTLDSWRDLNDSYDKGWSNGYSQR